MPIPDGAWPHAGQVTKLTLTERSWIKGSTRWADDLVRPTAVQSRRPGHALYVIARANRGQGPGTSYAGTEVPRTQLPQVPRAYDYGNSIAATRRTTAAAINITAKWSGGRR